MIQSLFFSLFFLCMLVRILSSKIYFMCFFLASFLKALIYYFYTEFVFAESISLVDFVSPYEVDITDYKPSRLGAIESSSVDSALTFPFVEDSKVACVSTKVTHIKSFLMNMILMLLFLGDRICSWIHNCLLASPCCSSRNCICMCPAHAYA